MEPLSLNLSIVVPTFSESQNVDELLRRLERTLGVAGWEIVFVDDDSPDGTASLVRDIARADRRVRCLQRVGRRGLSSACIEGMVGTEGAGRLIGPALGGLLSVWSIRLPFVAHGVLALLAIVPSFFLVRESAPRGTKSAGKNTEDQLDTKALVALMLDARYRGFLCAQFSHR